MTWLYYALATAFFYALFDFFLKISSSKIDSNLGAFIINLVATLVMLAVIIYYKIQGQSVFEIKPGGILYSVITGLLIGGASIFFIRMFALGTNISVGVPLVRVGSVLLAFLLGIIFLKEGFNLKTIAGFALSLAGLFLLVTSK